MKKALLIALTLVISVAFVTVVFAQAPAPEKAPMAPEKVKKAPAKKESGVKEESTPTSSAEKKIEKKKAPKAAKGGVKEESTPTSSAEKKMEKKAAPKAPKGGSIPQESTPATK
jgi:hypothetical protein